MIVEVIKRIAAIEVRVGPRGPRGEQGEPGSGGSAAWEDITGKPSTFPPSSHTHAIADTTGLQSALDGKAAASHTHAQSDVTGLTSALDGKADLVDGMVPTAQIPAIAITEFLGSVANEADMLALSGQRGDWCNRSDVSKAFVLVAEPASTLSNWAAIDYPASPVLSVNGQTGTIALGKSDIGLGNVTNALQLVASNNLSDLANAGTARSNLGLGTLATQSGTISDYLTTATAASTYASLSGSYADPAWITSLAWSKINAVPAMVTSLGALSLDTGISTSGMAEAVVTSNGSDLVYRGLSTGSFSSDDGGKVPVFGSSGTLRCTSAFSIFGNGTTGRSNLFFWTPDNTASVQIRGPANGSTGRILEWPLASGTLVSTGDTGTVTPTMLSDAQLISLAALSYTGNAGKVVAVNGAENNFELISVGGTGTVTSVAISGTDGIEVDSGSPITTSGTIQLGVNATTMKSTLNLTGTNSGDVTLSGTPDYITISGQTITRGLIDLTSDVTGDLPLSNLAQSSAASKLLGRGSASGGGDFEEITLGSGLSMSGTTLSASGSSGGNWVLISTTTISGSPTNLDFSFTGSYRNYMLQFEDVGSSDLNFILRMQTSADGGSTFDSGSNNYGYAYGPLGTYGPVQTTGTYIQFQAAATVGKSGVGFWGEVMFYDPLNTSERTFCKWDLLGQVWSSAATNLILGSGVRDSAAIVDAVRLFWSTGTFTSGKIRLFGWTE